MLNLSTNLDVVWKKPGYLSSAFGLGQVAWFFQTTSRLVDRFIPNIHQQSRVLKRRVDIWWVSWILNFWFDAIDPGTLTSCWALSSICWLTANPTLKCKSLCLAKTLLTLLVSMLEWRNLCIVWMEITWRTYWINHSSSHSFLGNGEGKVTRHRKLQGISRWEAQWRQHAWGEGVHHFGLEDWVN